MPKERTRDWQREKQEIHKGLLLLFNTKLKIVSLVWDGGDASRSD